MLVTVPRGSRSGELFLETFTTDASGLELEWDGKVWSIWVKGVRTGVPRSYGNATVRLCLGI